VQRGEPAPISFSEIVETSIATFAIHTSLQTNTPIEIPQIERK
jgi:hypothetical protein